ncbi:MAG: hypothetical protein NTX47_07535 [Candidatus Omnitrophica bacterium]|nr:hypothetical protein [Candidatus Omnitrophota bacterium]
MKDGYIKMSAVVLLVLEASLGYPSDTDCLRVPMKYEAVYDEAVKKIEIPGSAVLLSGERLWIIIDRLSPSVTRGNRVLIAPSRKRKKGSIILRFIVDPDATPEDILEAAISAINLEPVIKAFFIQIAIEKAPELLKGLKLPFARTLSEAEYRLIENATLASGFKICDREVIREDIIGLDKYRKRDVRKIALPLTGMVRDQNGNLFLLYYAYTIKHNVSLFFSYKFVLRNSKGEQFNCTVTDFNFNKESKALSDYLEKNHYTMLNNAELQECINVPKADAGINARPRTWRENLMSILTTIGGRIGL